MSSSQRQSHTMSRVQDTKVIQCMNKKCETKSKQQQCQAPIHRVFNDKNCQADKSINMQPKKPKKDMQSKEPAKDNNCKSIRIYNKSKCSDKNCQENENIDMWPVKPQMDVWLKK